MDNKYIPVIDLFAGPGGLSEGFSKVKSPTEQLVYKIELSIEKDIFAYQTLKLRSFYRQFIYRNQNVPEEYYQFLRGEIDLETLFNKYPDEYEKASNETWCVELGQVNVKELDKKITERIKNYKNWLLIGGPPCQAYSVVGRSRVGGISRNDPRIYLYKEYLRIIAYHQPAVFIMENVRGLLSARLDGEKIFEKIKSDLSNPSYIFPKSNSPKYKIFSMVKEPDNFNNNNMPEYNSDIDYLIKMEKYGIPQKRHRVILLGVREDIEYSGGQILTEKKEIKLKNVLDDLPKIRSRISRKIINSDELNGLTKPQYIKIKDSTDNWKKEINSIRNELKLPEINPNLLVNNSGAMFIPCESGLKPTLLRDWFWDKRIKGYSNHESRSHLYGDLKRYLYAADFMKKEKRSPQLSEYPDFLLPNHVNVKSGKFSDRFRVQNPENPATTITCHISKDGHYFIHYDSAQCRSFTVREAARIQTFPDNYYFCGPRTSQFIQVGNAVPPYLAKQIAEIVFKILIKYL